MASSYDASVRALAEFFYEFVLSVDHKSLADGLYLAMPVGEDVEGMRHCGGLLFGGGGTGKLCDR